MATSVTTLKRDDYRPFPWQISHVRLEFELDPACTRVQNQLELSSPTGGDLVLDGRALELEGIWLDDQPLPAGRWTHEPEHDRLTLHGLPPRCTVRIVSSCRPEANTALEGLYWSDGKLVTQCEAHGYRCITFHPDRPDVLSRYTVTLRASRERFPVLLSNGDPVSARELPEGRHEAVWQDPHPKPCYLFALVAGALEYQEDHFTTASGRDVCLRVYVEEHNLGKCQHALESLKLSMAWDEKAWGREYDLARFNIVAVADFNAGAMENKGLNIFNASAVLASPDTTIDDRFLYIERVVAHEYFHNWSGNRVTLRDWFELTLKEGLTIFRDQEFTADTHSRPMKRIDDVQTLRERQFPEDAGPLAHPIRPSAVADIDNFYTVTIYEKGAEVLRMLHTLVGPEAWRASMDEYFRRFDGRAISCDDCLDVIQDVSGRSLEQFRRWYDRAGTPRVSCRREWNGETGELTLIFSQSMAAHQGGTSLPPLLIPVRLGVLSPEGEELPLPVSGDGVQQPDLVELDRDDLRVILKSLPRGTAAPVPSLLRQYSAPVLLEDDLKDSERLLLMAHDSDPFNRWDAGQRLASDWILGVEQALREQRPVPANPEYSRALGKVLADGRLDPMMKSAFLTLPGFEALARHCRPLDPLTLFDARRHVIRELASDLRGQLLELYHTLASDAAWRFDFAEHGRRTLRNACLGWLSRLDEEEILQLARDQYWNAGNMSDRQAALALIAEQTGDWVDEITTDFHQRFRGHAEVVDSWLGILARSSAPGGLERVQRLQTHEAWQPANPNRVRALVGAFASNVSQFHGAGEAASRWYAEQTVAISAINAYVGAGLARSLGNWRRYQPDRAAMLRASLEWIRASEGLPAKVAEVCDLALKDA